MKTVIAVDGPAGAGKSTISKLLAKKLGFSYIDTGAMYRAITYLAVNEKIDLNNIDLNNKERLSKLAEDADIEFAPPGDDGICHIKINGYDVTDKIRKEKIDQNVTKVAKIKGVRDAMVKKQQSLSKKNSVVMDGRDIGSRVLPDADYKFFITASLEERARRRYQELKEKREDVYYKDIKNKIQKRDKVDRERKISPLTRTKDAVLIDTTDLSIDDVVNKIMTYIKDRNV